MRADCSTAALLTVAVALGALGVGGCAHEAAEGRPRVHQVHFLGNHRFDSGELLDHIALTAPSWVPWSGKRYYDPATLPVDRARIEAFYRARGFFQARVAAAEVKQRADASIDVAFRIDEGPAVHVQAIDYVGLDGLSPKVQSRVTTRLPLRRGDVFRHDRYLDAKALLEGRIKAEGYAWARVNGEARVDRERLTADVILRAEIGPPVRFGHLRVEGGRLQHQLERRAAFSPGETFDPAEVDATSGRFQATGLFSSVQLRLEPHPGDPTVADVVALLTPGKRNELKVGLGFGIDNDRQMVRIPFQYTRRGFLGGLRTLRIGSRVGWMGLPHIFASRNGPLADGDVTFTQPDFLAPNLAGRIVVGFDLGVDYAFKYYGPRGMLALDYSLWRDRLQLGASYNFQFLQFFSLAGPQVFNDPVLARSFLGYTNPYWLSYLVQDARLDLRDRPLDARRGGYFIFSVEEGVPLGGTFRYIKFSPDVRGYLPLGPRLVVAARVQYGYLHSLTSLASPITRRFYAGGADSHRGFGYDRLAPQVPSGISSLAIPIGGDRLFLAQFEVRADVVRIAGSWLGVASFVDAGDVPQRGFGIDFTQLHLATGFGLRYRTVVGTLRADLGIRLNRLAALQPDGRQNPDPGSRYVFHISLGEAF